MVAYVASWTDNIIRGSSSASASRLPCSVPMKWVFLSVLTSHLLMVDIDPPMCRSAYSGMAMPGGYCLRWQGLP
jgi:hypothetical protein